jgi:hypothetical protein
VRAVLERLTMKESGICVGIVLKAGTMVGRDRNPSSTIDLSERQALRQGE